MLYLFSKPLYGEFQLDPDFREANLIVLYSVFYYRVIPRLENNIVALEINEGRNLIALDSYCAELGRSTKIEPGCVIITQLCRKIVELSSTLQMAMDHHVKGEKDLAINAYKFLEEGGKDKSVYQFGGASQR